MCPVVGQFQVSTGQCGEGCIGLLIDHLPLAPRVEHKTGVVPPRMHL